VKRQKVVAEFAKKRDLTLPIALDATEDVPVQETRQKGWPIECA